VKAAAPDIAGAPRTGRSVPDAGVTLAAGAGAGQRRVGAEVAARVMALAERAFRMPNKVQTRHAPLSRPEDPDPLRHLIRLLFVGDGRTPHAPAGR
jgi:hypothetical protein